MVESWSVMSKRPIVVKKYITNNYNGSRSTTLRADQHHQHKQRPTTIFAATVGSTVVAPRHRSVMTDAS